MSRVRHNNLFVVPLGLAVAMTMFMAMGGCGKSGSSGKKKPLPRPVETRTAKGPVTMLVRADRCEARVAEPIELKLEVRSANGVDVTLPDAKDKTLGPFEIADMRDLPDMPSPDGKGRIWTRIYTLVSLRGGELTIPAMTVKFTDRRKSAKGICAEISSKPIDLKIVSVLKGKADPAKFRDIKPPVELPPQPSYFWVWLTTGGVIVLLLGWVAVRLILRARKQRVLRADRWALSRLARLGELIEAGQIELFYIKLSDIVRQYIERRFRIHAPKQTTREFLAMAQEHPRVAKYRDDIGQCLQAADMVKFARYRPDRGQSDEAMEKARRFIIASAARQNEPEKREVGQ